MTPRTDFDRLLTSWLEAAGPADVRVELIDDAMRTARTTRRLGTVEALVRGLAEWPPYRLGAIPLTSDALRFGIAMLLIAALLGAIVAVGGRTPPTPRVRVTPPAPPTDAVRQYAGVYRVVAPGMVGDSVVGLPSGKVLFQSWNDTGAKLLELDVETAQYVDTGARLGRREEPTGILLSDGRVLFVGGDLSEPIDTFGSRRLTAITAEIYDPVTRRTMGVGEPVHRTLGPAIVGLPDGRVLLAGGGVPDRDDVVPLTSAQLFDPRTMTFAATGSMTRPLAFPQVVVLADGRVLVVGRAQEGNVAPSGELYDPSTGSFVAVGSARPVPDPAQPTRWPITARGPLVALRDGRAALLGVNCQEESGTQDEEPAITDLFDPGSGTFVPGPLMPHCVEHALALPNGEVYVAGYYKANGDVSWSGLFDPRSGGVRVTERPPGGPYYHVTPLRDGRILAYAEGDSSVRIFE